MIDRIMRSRDEDDLDDSHPLHVAYRIEKIPREHVPLCREGRHRSLWINCWKPIEDDKSILFSANHATRAGRVMEIIRKCRCRLWILRALSNGSHKTIMGSVEWCEEKMEMMRKRVHFILSRDTHVNLYWFSLSAKVAMKVIDMRKWDESSYYVVFFLFRGGFQIVIFQSVISDWYHPRDWQFFRTWRFAGRN